MHLPVMPSVTLCVACLLFRLLKYIRARKINCEWNISAVYYNSLLPCQNNIMLLIDINLFIVKWKKRIELQYEK